MGPGDNSWSTAVTCSGWARDPLGPPLGPTRGSSDSAVGGALSGASAVGASAVGWGARDRTRSGHVMSLARSRDRLRRDRVTSCRAPAGARQGNRPLVGLAVSVEGRRWGTRAGPPHGRDRWETAPRRETKSTQPMTTTRQVRWPARVEWFLACPQAWRQLLPRPRAPSEGERPGTAGAPRAATGLRSAACTGAVRLAQPGGPSAMTTSAPTVSLPWATSCWSSPAERCTQPPERAWPRLDGSGVPCRAMEYQYGVPR